MTTRQLTSPYVGPMPFQDWQVEIFCGREREKADLCSLIAAHGEVLLYAPSGAGKSSLLNAGVIPALRTEGFEVRPIVRVSPGADARQKETTPRNIYMFNALSSWADESSDFTALSQKSLSEFLGLETAGSPSDDERKLSSARPFPYENVKGSRRKPELLIFDQLEEIFELWPERWREREDFFDQIRDALENGKHLRILFAIREDYLARLLPCVETLPERMKTRFRLDPLSRTSAEEAVTKPLEKFGTKRFYGKGVAKNLVDNLSLIRIKDPNGAVREVVGQSVEPLQLSVVCESLWRHLPPEVVEITNDALKDFGNVDDMLGSYYNDCLREAAKTGVPEAKLRAAFTRAFITPEGTRGIVYRGREQTAGIPNIAVDILEHLHLIRQDERAGGGWYELSHDRFIGPIQQSNGEWVLHLGPTPDVRLRLESKVGGWVASKQSPRFLLSHDDLDAAEEWIRSAGPDGIGFPPELPELIRATKEMLYARKTKILLMCIGVALVCVATVLLALGFSMYALRKWESRELADRAQYGKNLGVRQRVLSALQSAGYGKSQYSGAALDAALQAKRTMGSGTQTILVASFDQVDNRVATASIDGSVRIWQTVAGSSEGSSPIVTNTVNPSDSRQSPLQRFPNDQLWAPNAYQNGEKIQEKAINAISEKSTCGDEPLAATTVKFELSPSNAFAFRELLDINTGVDASSKVYNVALTPDGRYVVTQTASGLTQVWDVNRECLVQTLPESGYPLATAFSLDGRGFLSANLTPGQVPVSKYWKFNSGKLMNPRILSCEGAEALACTQACRTEGIVTSASFGPGSTLAIGTIEGNILIWDPERTKCVDAMAIAGGVSAIAYRRDGKVLALSPTTNVASSVWSLETKKPETQLAEPPSSSKIIGMGFSKDGFYLKTAMSDGAIYIHTVDFENSKTLAAQELGSDSSIFPISYGACVDLLNSLGKGRDEKLTTRHVQDPKTIDNDARVDCKAIQPE